MCRWLAYTGAPVLLSRVLYTQVRAAIESPVQQTNCHPFRHGRWLFMHNGYIDGFAAVKRDLVLAVDELLFPEISGTADTEALSCLSLTFALEDDPPESVARAIGFVEDCGQARGVQYPFQGTIATTDGESLWVFRYFPRGQVTVAVLHPRRACAPARVPGPGDLGRGIRRRAAGGLRADRQPARRLGGDARGQLRSDQQGRRPAAAVRPQASGPGRGALVSQADRTR